MATLDEVQQELTKRLPHTLVLGAAVDGSQMSDRAVSIACGFADFRRKDRLLILHIADKSKTYLPRHLQPTHLHNFYEDLAGKHHVKSEWVCVDKVPQGQQSTCEMLTALADRSGVDLLVVGSFGRKGEKLDVLGSVTDFSLRQAHCSVCIVRSTSRQWQSGSCKFLFATDGSHAAAVAFCVLMRFLRKTGDTVDVVMVTGQDGEDEAKVVAQYKAFLEAANVTGTCRVKCIDRLLQKVPAGILEAVEEQDSDVLVLGISGYSKRKLGSVTEEVSHKATCTTIVIKDGKEEGNRFTSAGMASIAQEFTKVRPSLDIARGK